MYFIICSWYTCRQSPPGPFCWSPPNAVFNNPYWLFFMPPSVFSYASGISDYLYSIPIPWPFPPTYIPLVLYKILDHNTFDFTNVFIESAGAADDLISGLYCGPYNIGFGGTHVSNPSSQTFQRKVILKSHIIYIVFFLYF